jgi:hypothetical protein
MVEIAGVDTWFPSSALLYIVTHSLRQFISYMCNMTKLLYRKFSVNRTRDT